MKCCRKGFQISKKCSPILKNKAPKYLFGFDEEKKWKLFQIIFVNGFLEGKKRLAVINGKNFDRRLYHHTVTCLPIYPKELDNDSEGENDPKWLQTRTMMMIDDFTDVNEGEKELMKMWNLHVMKYGYVGDCQIPLACQMFLETRGKELLMKNLYRNFVLHMSSLFDFGLVSPVVLYQTIQKLQEIMKEGGEDSDVRKILQKSHEAQVEKWITTGIHASMSSSKQNVSASAKTNFNNEIPNGNARRKTCLPIGSPPSSQSAKNNVPLHNSVSKHASMIGNSNKISPHPSANNIPQKSALNNLTAKNSPSNLAPKNPANSNPQKELSPRLEPVRRKSTNSIGNDNSTAPPPPPPLRRKSMATENVNEIHRRKLVLDSLPNPLNSNQKNSNGAVH